jgi:hypothetical protein
MFGINKLRSDELPQMCAKWPTFGNSCATRVQPKRMVALRAANLKNRRMIFYDTKIARLGFSSRHAAS